MKVNRFIINPLVCARNGIFLNLMSLDPTLNGKLTDMNIALKEN